MIVHAAMTISCGEQGVLSAYQDDEYVSHTRSRYSILPAISLSGVLYIDIIARSWNGEEFSRYLDALLDRMQPYPNPNSVLVMDNSSVHHFQGVREKVEAR